jgi:hypothetical protein
LQSVLEADDVIGRQDDIDSPAAFGETVDALVAPEFEPVVQAELHRLDAGFVFAVWHAIPFAVVPISIGSR